MRRITAIGVFLCAGLLSLAACTTEPTSPVPAARDVVALDVSADAEFFGAADFSAEQAEHINGFPCGLGPAGLTFDSKVVITPSGNATLTCHGETASGPPQTVVFMDVPCGVPGAGLTFDSHFVWTKSGQATLVCHVKG